MKKLLFALTIALIATLVIATPTLAWWSQVTGTVRDSKTGAVWPNDVNVTVWDCTSIGSGALGGPTNFPTGDLSAGVSISGAPASPEYLCIEIEIEDSGGGVLVTKWKVIQSLSASGDEGNYPMGDIYTDTGPNVVTLAEADAGSSNVWLPVALGVVALVGAGGVVLLLRRRRVA